jgi:hypothetical protein
MSDRRDLQQELNKINQLYQEYDLQLSKAGASMEQRNQLRSMMNQKKEELIAQRGDSLQNMNIGKSIKVKDGTITKAGKDILGEGMDLANMPRVGKSSAVLRSVGKKLMGGIPVLAGVASAFDSGDAAAAIPGLDQESVGMSPEAEDMMLAEIQAKKNYANSPGRMAKLQSLMGRSPAASSSKDAQQLEDEAAMNDPYMKKPRIDDSEEKLKAYSKVAKPLKDRSERLKKKQD